MNMAEFLIEPPARCPGWVAALTTPITAALNKLNEEMESMNTKMDSMHYYDICYHDLCKTYIYIII